MQDILHLLGSPQCCNSDFWAVLGGVKHYWCLNRGISDSLVNCPCNLIGIATFQDLEVKRFKGSSS